MAVFLRGPGRAIMNSSYSHSSALHTYCKSQRSIHASVQPREPSFRQIADTQMCSAAAFEAISPRHNAQRVEPTTYRRPVPEQCYRVSSSQQNHRDKRWKKRVENYCTGLQTLNTLKGMRDELKAILIHMSASLPDQEEFENRANDLVDLLKVAVPLFRGLRRAHSIFGFLPALANLGWEWAALRAVQSQMFTQYQMNPQLSRSAVMIVETLEVFAKESGMWLDPGCKIGTTHPDFLGSDDEMHVDQDVPVGPSSFSASQTSNGSFGLSSVEEDSLASSYAGMGVSASLMVPQVFNNMSDFMASLKDMVYIQLCATEATQLLIKARNPSLPVFSSDVQYIAQGLADFLASKKQAWWLFDINAIFATCREWFDGVTGLREQLNVIDKLIMRSKGADLREFRIQLRKVQKVVQPHYEAEKQAQCMSSSAQPSSQTAPPPFPPPPPPAKPSGGDETNAGSSGVKGTSASGLNFSTTNFAPSSKPGTFKSAAASTKTAAASTKTTSVTSSPALTPLVAPASTPQQPPSPTMSNPSSGVQNGVVGTGVNFHTNFAPSSKPGTFKSSARSSTSATVGSSTAAQTVPPPASAPLPASASTPTSAALQNNVVPSTTPSNNSTPPVVQTPNVRDPAHASSFRVKTFTGTYNPALITSNDILKSFFANTSLQVLLEHANNVIRATVADDKPLQSQDVRMHWSTCQLVINASSQPWFDYKVVTASEEVTKRWTEMMHLRAQLKIYEDSDAQQTTGQCQQLLDQLLTFDTLLRTGSRGPPANFNQRRVVAPASRAGRATS